MALKDILVHVDGTPRSEARLDLAVSMAMEHGAHLIALHVRTRPPLGGLVLEGSIESYLAEDEAATAARAKAMVEARLRTSVVSLEWRDASGDPVEIIALHGRYCDLVILGQTPPDEDGGQPLADALVLALGRPVLVVPHSGAFPTMGRRVLVAWNASREATRAVHDALPLLVRADTVRVIAVNPGHGMAGHGDIPGADICLHLSRHGVNAVCEHIRSEDIDAAVMLLNRAADEDCDLLVMGGYGRSRLREMVLGGATRHLLGHMTLPVMLSH